MGANADGLLVIRERLVGLAQIPQGFAAVGEARRKVDGEVTAAFLLDLTGVGGDSLVVIREP